MTSQDPFRKYETTLTLEIPHHLLVVNQAELIAPSSFLTL